MNTSRESIYLSAFEHKNPIPAACRKGNMLMSGIVYGLDPDTGRAAETLERQCELMFVHMRAILAEAGTTPAAVVKVNVWMQDRSQRAPLNREWLAMFPDADDRPVRQAMEIDLTAGKLVQCDFVAILDDSESTQTAR